MTTDDGFRRCLSDAYYAGNVDFETVESILGREEAMRMKLVRASLNRGPPEPQFEDGILSDDAFYNGEISEWTPDDSSDDGSSKTRN